MDNEILSNIQKIIKSPYDNCEYENIVLKNNLKTLIISDKTTDISYIAMVVNVGTLLDGETFGLAHLVEHMLFMGNSKYPDGSHYFEYINKHGGTTNAFTDTLTTCYYLSIPNIYFDNCIDMFGHFFTDPLFDNDAIEREINIIDSEYHKNLDIESFRIKHALKLLTTNEHPFKNFDIGSYNTLKVNDIRNKILQFYTKYYVANNMKLIIYNNEDTTVVKSKLTIFENISFLSDINNKFTYKFGAPLQCNDMIRIVTPMHSHNLLLFWAINYDNDYSKYGMLKYIYYLLGRESEGSISHILINNALIDSLYVSTFVNCGDFLITYMNIKLTEYGYINVDVVVSMIEQYINKLNVSGLDKNNFKLFNKCINLNFVFDEQKQPEQKIMKIINNMSLYGASLHHAVSDSKIICHYNNSSIMMYNNLMSSFVDKRASIVLSSPRCYINCNTYDKLFGIQYNIEKNSMIHEHLLFEFSNINYFSKMFIPKHLYVYKNKNSQKYPNKLYSMPDVWFKYEQSPLPKACILVSIKLPFVYSDIKTYIALRIRIAVIQRELRKILFDMTLCNTTYDLVLEHDMLFIKLYGFNDKIGNMLECIINYLLNCNIDFNSFSRARSEYYDQMMDNKNIPPFMQLSSIIDSVTYTNYYTEIEQQKFVYDVTFTNVSEIDFMKHNGIKCIINGNITTDKCMEIRNILSVLDKNNSKQKCKYENFNERHSGIVTHNFHNNNSNVLCDVVIHIYLDELRNESIRHEFMYLYAMNEIVNKILSDKFFNKFRTKQLGYIVKNDTGIIGFNPIFMYQHYYIQSSKYSSQELSKNILCFLKESYNEYIINISYDDLRKYISACINDLKINIKTLEERTSEIFTYILNDTYAYDTKYEIENIMNNVTLNEIIEFYTKYFISDTKKYDVIMIE